MRKIKAITFHIPEVLSPTYGTGDGLKATLAMKKDIETLTSENTVEILF